MRKFGLFRQVFSMVLVVAMVMSVFNFSVLAQTEELTESVSEKTSWKMSENDTLITQESEVEITSESTPSEDLQPEDIFLTEFETDDVYVEKLLENPDEDGLDVSPAESKGPVMTPHADSDSVMEITNDMDFVPVENADELEAAILNGGAICLAADFELDRTFYITQDTYIYSDEARVLTRSSDFFGDVFVVGEGSDGVICEDTVILALGNPESAESDLLTIDGNADNMSETVTGTVVFVTGNGQADLYGDLTLTNNKKFGNERTLDEKYAVSYPDQIGGAAVILASGTLNVLGAKFINNTVHNVEGEESARGGAIYSLGALNIYGAEFTGNSAARGGAIYNYNETHIYNATFSQNSTTYRGGAIYLPNTSHAKLFLGEENEICENAVVFDSNTSVDRGGAVFGYGTIKVNNSQFINNSSTQNHGGAIVADGRIEGIAKTLVVTNSLFENNSSYYNGGAVYLSGTDASFENVEFNTNVAYATANSSGTRYGGGAVYSTGSNSEFNTVTFKDNRSEFIGGAAAFYSQSTVKMNGVTANSNTSESHGSVIYLNNSEAEVTDSVFAGNTSSDHGGALYATKSKATVTGSEFTGNTAATNGGAVYLTGSEAVIDDTEFKNNTASGNGGAIYTTNSSSKITNSDFAENEADKGGAVYFHTTSTAELSNVSFTQNKATTDAGAVRIDGGSTVVMNKITAERNSSNQAGFLYNNASVLNLYNSTVNENTALLYNSGAIHSAAKSSSNIYKTKFSKNSAQCNGGTLYMYTDSVESVIHSCTFTENTAGGYGGVMYASGKSIVKMYNTVATDNAAGNGGFLYETTTGTTVTMAGLTVSGNTATVGGPIIWGNSTGAVLNIDKEKYFDADNTGELNDSYWTEAIVNKLTVNNLSVDIPGYDDYEGEEGGEGDTPNEPEEKEIINIKTSSQLEQALRTGFTAFRIVADFELDRTFYITEDTYIFADEAHNLTRKADFAGDIFVVGENSDGTFTENPVTLTFGNPEAESENLLVIDGNKDNLSVNVTGTVFFIGNNSTVDLHKVTVKNNKKLGNVRTLDEKYSASYPEQIGGAAVIIDSGTLNIYGATLLNNIVHDVEGEASSRGGAIYSFGTLNVYGANISENSAARGGAIYSYKATNIYNASITKNHASYRGGAVYMPASVNSRLTMGGANEVIKAEVLFEENSANDNGGAIFDQGVLTANNTTFLKNTSVKAGGAIAAYGYESLGNNKSVAVSNSVFDQNTSAGGGAVALYSNATAIFSNTSFTNNTSTSTGGAVVADSADVKVYGSTFENNTASSHGGALIASNEAIVYMSNVKANGNSSGGNGGAMYATASKIEIDGAEIKDNSATSQGGAFSMHRATATGIVSELTFNKITASGNTAGAMGGFLYNNHSVLKMYNSDIKDNYSTSHGGAISLQGVADTSIYNTKFTNNSCGTAGASVNGGAMYVYTDSTSTLLHSCTFESNSAPNLGGVSYVSNASLLTMYNTTAKNNSATDGGFMCVTAAESKNVSVTMSGTTVSGNTATNGPIIWGRTTRATLNINKSNYTDLDYEGELDKAYWSGALANKLTIKEISTEVPRYQDYNNELYDEYDEVMDVSSASELEFALGSGAKNIRIVESFEVDRTFYVTGEVVIFTTASKTLTRKPDFAGDIFVVGEDAEGNSSIELGKTAKLTLGNQYSESEDFLIIDGNSENMTVPVTGTVLFLEEGSQIDLYKGVTIQNNRKEGNDRILKEKYLVSNANRVGGAAMIISDGTVNIYGAKLKNNAVNEEPTGEEVTEEDRISYLGGAIYSRGTFNIHSGLFEGNAAGRGGVIYNIRDLKIYGGKFIGNHASTNGGAVYLAGSQFSQMYAGDPLNSAVSDKILFKDNTSVGHGGALYCAGMAIAMIYGDTTFEGNRTESNGGAIATYGMVDTNNVVMKNNYAYNLGGAAYIANANDDTVTRIVTFENTLFEENTARNGGAVAVYASSEELSEGGILEIQKCNFNKNKAINTRDTEVTSNVFGGAVYITRKSTLNITDTNFTENEALFEGGAIYAAGESETTVSNSNFTKNKTAHESDAKGGAVSVHSATLDFDNAAFTENSTCKNGGAIYVSYTTAALVNSDVNVKNSRFEKNVAGNAGGAIYATKHAVETKEDEIVNIKNTSFNENTAALGGAAYFTSYSDAYMKDVTFTKNTASSTKVNSYGGALYLTNSAVAEIDGGQFTENISTYCAGAVSLHSSARAVMNEVVIENNSAPTSAGCLYVNNSRLDMYESEVRGNTAGVNGGAIAMYNSAVANLNNTVFDSNTSLDGSGGAIYNTSSEVESVFHSCTFKNNTSPKFGGALYASSGAILKMYNTLADGNSAQKGGVLYETTTDTEVTINGMTVKGNTATEAGPIIFGNTYKSILNIHKLNYNDEDRDDEADDNYWDYAIANELTVNDLSGVDDEIPECDTYVSKAEDEEEEKERIPVPVDDVLSLGLNSSDGVITSAYSKLPRLDTSSNFMSLNTTVFPDINGKDVTVDTFVSHKGDPANNCTVGEGILLYQAILYKQAHPEEEVNISIASFRFSALAAVNINRNSRYFGYMRNLPDRDYDKYGFVRLSYLLVTAAKMGVNVTVVGQLDGYPQPSSAPTLYEYFTYYLDEPCDPQYADGKFVRDYMTFGYCEWTSYDNKAATDMMHTKMCAVSHYLDMNGNVGRNAVWSSSSNLDGINSNATNGNDKMQTATIVSNHEEIYRAAYNYINIIPEYCGQEEVYNFRTMVAAISKNQIDLIEAGRGNEIKPEEQIVYLGTENDDVFELYFSPFGGDVMTWTESYNPYCKFVRKFSNSDDYVIMSWNSANYNKSTPIVLQLEEMLTNTFLTKKNPNNKIYTNLEDFDSAPYKNLVLGQDIGFRSFNQYDHGALHSKDLQLSYSENGERKYVSILSSINMHGGAMSYQSNYVLVVKEDNCNEDSVFFTVADQTSVGIVEHTYGEEKTFLPENENEDGYTYVECEFCDKVIIGNTVHRPGEWVVAKESTATENGISYQECMGCGEIITAKEVVGKESDVTYTEGIKFSKNTDSRIPAVLSSMPLTIEAVVQVPKSHTARAGVIASNYEANRKNLVCVEIIANGKARLYYRNNSLIQDTVFNTDIRSNVPKHIAITVDGNKATLYVDGEAVESNPLSLEYPAEYGNMYIGGDDRAGNLQYFKGTIYSVSMFGDVRTAEEVKADAVVVPSDGDNLLYSETYPIEKEEAGPVAKNTVIHPVAIPFTAQTSYGIGTLSATPRTFEAIISVPTDYNDRGGVIVSNYNGGTGPQISIEIQTGGRPRLYSYTGSKRIDCVFSTDVRSDNPRHIAITVDGKKATLYVDGEAVETKTLLFEIAETTENFKIGGDDRSENAQYFKGEIQAVSLFGDVRTAEEIKSDAVLVTAYEDDLLYSGYFTEKNSKNILMTVKGNTFTKDNAKAIPKYINTPHTFDAVIQIPKSVNGRGGIIAGNYSKGEKNVVSFEVYNDGKARLYYSSDLVVESCVFDTDVRSDKPVRVTVAVEDVQATLYINGEAVETKTLTVPYPEMVEDLKIGGDNRDGNGQYFKGTIYSTAIYEDVLDAADIKKGILYNSEKATYSALMTTQMELQVSGEGRVFSTNTKTLVPVNINEVPLTFEAIINVPEDVEGRAGVIAGNYRVNRTNIMSFEVFDGGRVRLFGKTTITGPSIECTFDTDIRSDKAVHVAVTVDGLVATLYINGEAVETKTLEYALPETVENFKIGGDNRAGNGQYFKGTIYSVALFSDVRTAEEIALDVIGVAADADAVLYNTDFTKEICPESVTGGMHIEGDWIIDRVPADLQTGLKHTECIVCGKILGTKEYSSTEGNGESVDFTASDAGLVVSTPDDVVSTGDFAESPRTFEALIKLPKSYSDRAGTLIGNYDGGKGEQINVEIYNNGKPRLYYKYKNKAYTYLFTTDVRSDSITHLAITVDGNVASLYLNGELKETVAISGTFSTATAGFKVGADNRTSNPQLFKGTIYGVSIFSDARTAEEIALDRFLVIQSADNILYSNYFID